MLSLFMPQKMVSGDSMSFQFNRFTKFNLLAGQYLLYIYLIAITLIVIHQIKLLRDNDTKIECAIRKIDAAHKHTEEMMGREAQQQKQITLMLELLKREHKEAKTLEQLLKGCK